MAKLAVYLPDDLAEQVRAAGVSPSPVCQRALAEAVAGPKVTVLWGGWCRVQLDRVETMVRFVAGPGSAVVGRECVAAAADFNRDLWSVTAALEDWANGDVRDDLLQAIKDRDGLDRVTRALRDDEYRGQAARRVEWGTDEEAVGDLRPVDPRLVSEITFDSTDGIDWNVGP